jgi:NADH-quinone oxidoreductase subunit G
VPKVTINGRTIEVAAGTNLIEAAIQVGVQIPHYCYHPRLSVVGQCRMCLVEITENGRKMQKPQAACSMQVMKDGWDVRTDVPEIEAAQRGMMEFFLINHPLDCPICDQAGECGLQDYSFKHGVAFSRFRYEDKRTYPGRERIPLGANVLLNMNRCIQCTRCVRFTHEIAGTGELGFFNRGARVEIGTFPGRELNNDLATCVVDICPVGALTSTRFRFAERVFYLDKKPSVCTGCEVGCNITVEHRRGAIKRYKPRFNVEVNDYWMCDYGRSTFERYKALPRLASPRVRAGVGAPTASMGSTGSWDAALDRISEKLGQGGTVAILGSGFLSTEEAYLLGKIADLLGTPHRSVPVDLGPPHRIPNTKGGISGREAAPNRRGAELAGLAPGVPAGSDAATALGPEELLAGDGATSCDVLIVADSDFGMAAHDPKVVERLRRAKFLVVCGWADTPLAQGADVALPVANATEREGTFVNVEWRVQRCERAMPAPGQARPLVEALSDLLSRSDRAWAGLSAGSVFDRLAAEHPAFAGLSWHDLPATGAALKVAGAHPALATEAAAAAPEVTS